MEHAICLVLGAVCSLFTFVLGWRLGYEPGEHDRLHPEDEDRDG